MATGLVNRIIRLSLVDGPGSRMVVFLQGCNMRCVYCHNPETQQSCDGCGLCVSVCEHEALVLVESVMHHNAALCRRCDRCIIACPRGSSPRCTLMTAEHIAEEAERIAPFIDGLTVSGGECSQQPEFLLDLCQEVHNLPRLTVLLDTNGLMPETICQSLLGLADGFLVDLKALEPVVHRALTGADNELVLDNLRRIAAAGKLTEIRTVIVPGFNDSDKEIRRMAEWVHALDAKCPWRLSPFRPQGVRTALGAQGVEFVRFRDLADVACEVHGTCVVSR